jgi:hypothetical protein
MAFAYKRELTVTNNVASALTDFQSELSLTSVNFDFTKAKADGGDVRFYEEESATTPVDYWIEAWDDGAEPGQFQYGHGVDVLR